MHLLHTQPSMALLFVVLAAFIWAAAADTQYVVVNNAPNVGGGQKFDQAIGSSQAQDFLSSASQFIQQTFYAGNPSYPQKQVAKVTLYVDDMSGVAYTVGDSSSPDASEIHLSADYVGNYSSGDLVTEIKGVLYHETTHVWQWNGQGTADGGLIEGIADYIRLTAGLPAVTWGSPGGGNSWDEGYSVTAYFLQYCESLKSGFVANLNAKLYSGWDVSYFQDLLGKSVDELWQEYKAKYGM